jgi:Bacterial SH3 domain
MKSISAILNLALFGSAWLSIVVSGCAGPQMQQTEANGAWSSSSSPLTIAERQLDPLLAQVSQLEMVSRESLDAARLIGVPDHELIAAQQDYAAAKQLLHDGQAAYRARQYELSWDTLRAADAAFRRAEEAAVRAGLGQLEDELAADYGRFLNPEARSGRPITGAARVSQGPINLRDGAGTHFQVIGKALLGDTLTILFESGEWYRVQTGTGLVGWVSKTVLTHIATP